MQIYTRDAENSAANCFICAKWSQERFYRRTDICVESCKVRYYLQVDGKQAAGIKRDILGREFGVRKGIMA